MNTQLAYKRQAPAQNYHTNQIMSMTPTQLILKVYDIAIVSIKRADIVRANKAILELINSLNFDYNDIASGLLRLYQFCQKSLREKKYDDAVQVLTDLRATWASAFNLK
jgi:flagellar secretion chaperone FliS